MVRWRCCSKVENCNEVELGAAREPNMSTGKEKPAHDKQQDSAAVESKQTKELKQFSDAYNPDDLNAVRSWRERNTASEGPVTFVSGVSDSSVENDEMSNDGEIQHDEGANISARFQQEQRHLQQQHLLELQQHEEHLQLQLQGNEQSSRNEEADAARVGGFPTFTAKEEEWRRNHLLNKEAYLSSSSSSSLEDKILRRHFYPIGDLAPPGPIDLDDLEMEDEEICSSSISRPGTDDGENQPLGTRQFSHVQVSDVQFLASSHRNPSVTAEPESASDDNVPLHLAVNCGTADSDELDAIVAAINDQTEQQNSSLSEHGVDLGERFLDASISPRSNGREMSSRSPLDTPSAQPLPQTTQSSKAQRLAPSRRDSPSLHDPNAYGGRKAESPVLITPYASYDSNESNGTNSKSSAASPSSANVAADQRRRERSRSRGRERKLMPLSQKRSDFESSISSQAHESSAERSHSPSPPPSSKQVDDNDERLSDIPSDVDVIAKERYLKACRILKSAIIEKDTSIDPSEKVFLASLLQDDPPSTTIPPTPDRLEAAFDLTTQSSRSNPLFDSTTSIVSSTYADHRKGQHEICSELTLSPVQITERTLLMHTSKAQTSDRTTGNETESTRKPTLSHTSSSLFSRIDDDYPFKILGSQGFKPTVLTPTVMEALRGFFPYAVSEENYLLKYALERDGSALMSLLSKVRACSHTIISVETTDGFVFGAFCSSPWRIQPSWFGSGESFLWRLKNPRVKNDSQTYNNDGDNEIEIYPNTGADDFVQFCTPQTIAVGGGTDWGSTKYGSPYEGEPSGIGFLIDGDLLGGETSSSVTFANPRLGNRMSKTQEFEIHALEVWTVTPCLTLSDAEDLEMGKLLREELSLRQQ